MAKKLKHTAIHCRFLGQAGPPTRTVSCSLVHCKYLIPVNWIEDLREISNRKWNKIIKDRFTLHSCKMLTSKVILFTNVLKKLLLLPLIPNHPCCAPWLLGDKYQKEILAAYFYGFIHCTSAIDEIRHVTLAWVTHINL